MKFKIWALCSIIFLGVLGELQAAGKKKKHREKKKEIAQNVQQANPGESESLEISIEIFKVIQFLSQFLLKGELVVDKSLLIEEKIHVLIEESLQKIYKKFIKQKDGEAVTKQKRCKIINILNSEGETLLHILLQFENLNFRAIQMVVEAGADLNAINGQGHIPIQVLLNTVHSSWGHEVETPSGRAVEIRRPENHTKAVLQVIQLLKEYGFDINREVKGGMSILWHCLRELHLAIHCMSSHTMLSIYRWIIEILLEEGADPNVAIFENLYPLYQALFCYYDLELVRIFLEQRPLPAINVRLDIQLRLRNNHSLQQGPLNQQPTSVLGLLAYCIQAREASHVNILDIAELLVRNFPELLEEARQEIREYFSISELSENQTNIYLFALEFLLELENRVYPRAEAATVQASGHLETSEIQQEAIINLELTDEQKILDVITKDHIEGLIDIMNFSSEVLELFDRGLASWIERGYSINNQKTGSAPLTVHLRNMRRCLRSASYERQTILDRYIPVLRSLLRYGANPNTGSLLRWSIIELRCLEVVELFLEPRPLPAVQVSLEFFFSNNEVHVFTLMAELVRMNQLSRSDAFCIASMLVQRGVSIQDVRKSIRNRLLTDPKLSVLELALALQAIDEHGIFPENLRNNYNVVSLIYYANFLEELESYIDSIPELVLVSEIEQEGRFIALNNTIPNLNVSTVMDSSLPPLEGPGDDTERDANLFTTFASF